MATVIVTAVNAFPSANDDIATAVVASLPTAPSIAVVAAVDTVAFLVVADGVAASASASAAAAAATVAVVALLLLLLLLFLLLSTACSCRGCPQVEDAVVGFLAF